MEEGALNGTARPGSGAPHEGAEWGKGWGWLFPAEEIRDWANRKVVCSECLIFIFVQDAQLSLSIYFSILLCVWLNYLTIKIPLFSNL